MKLAYILSTIMLLTFSACASMSNDVVEGHKKPVKMIYIWDADGHTDINLLNGLKGEAGAFLRSNGFALAADADSTDAYLKITVIDAYRDGDRGKSYIKARLYILDSSDNTTIYDATYEASASGGGFDGPEYPIQKFVEGVLADFVKEQRK